MYRYPMHKIPQSLSPGVVLDAFEQPIGGKSANHHKKSKNYLPEHCL